MLDVRPDSESTARRSSIPDLIRRREAGEPVVLAVNGTSHIVGDDQSFANLVALLERLETIEGLRAGLDDLNAGRTRPVGEFFEELRRESEGRGA